MSLRTETDEYDGTSIVEPHRHDPCNSVLAFQVYEERRQESLKIMEELKNKFDKIQEVISFIEVSEKVQVRVGFALVVGGVIGAYVCMNISNIVSVSVSFFVCL